MNSASIHFGRRYGLVALWSVTTLALAPVSAMAVNFTLSDQALMAFDTVYTAQNATLVRKTDVPGPGVELQIALTSNTFSFFYGLPLNEGVLSRTDYQQFDNFTLKFTYVDVLGDLPAVNSAGLVGAGCSIGGAYVSPWIAPVTGPTNTASIRTSAMGGREQWIGLDVTSWSSMYHNPGGAVVTLLVEADPTAVVLPEPGSLFLSAFGGLLLLRNRRKR